MLDQDRFYTDLGRLISKARKEHGLTQEDLAKVVGLTRTSITNIERGRQKLLVHTLADVARCLAIPLASLLVAESTEPSVSLDRVLEGRPEPERNFILAAVTAVRPGSARS